LFDLTQHVSIAPQQHGEFPIVSEEEKNQSKMVNKSCRKQTPYSSTPISVSSNPPPIAAAAAASFCACRDKVGKKGMAGKKINFGGKITCKSSQRCFN
jgi:hypothetical protein